MTIKNIIFDNDQTLYRVGPELRQALLQAFVIYVAVKLGIPTDEVMPLRQRLFAKYGVDSSAYLFARECGIEYDEFVANTCMKVDPTRYGVYKDMKLRSALDSSNAKMSILTNNYSEYARKITMKLGVAARFEHIIGYRELGYVLKPDPRAFLRTEKITGYKLDESMFVDDRRDFLLPAKQLGMTTVLVGSKEGYAEPWIDYRIDDIYRIREILRG